MIISRYFFIHIITVACLFFFNVGEGFITWQIKQIKKQMQTVKPDKKKGEKIIEICKKKGLDKKGWVDVTKLSSYNLNHVNISIENGKVICNEGNQLVQVKVIHNEKISSKNGNSFYLLYLDYVNTLPDFKMINPLPIMSTGWDDNIDLGINLSSADKADLNKNDKLFPKDFEAYILCQKEGEQAYFIPKNTNSINFIAPPWEVAVDIKMYRNPMVAYGRQFKITVLDNIDVLENGKRTFIWPIPARNMIDVYTMYKMTKVGKSNSCYLSRDAVTFEVSLRCDNTSFLLNKKVFNSSTAILFGIMNISLLLQFLFIGEKDVQYNFMRHKELQNYKHMTKYMKNVDIKDPDDELDDKIKGVITRDVLKKSKIKKLVETNLYGVATWVGFLLVWKAYDFFKLMKEIRDMHKEFKKAEFVYPWKLQSPGVYEK